MGADGTLHTLYQTYDFPEEVRVEFIDGEIVMQADPLALHDYVGRYFVRAVPDPFMAWNERGIDVSPEDKPKADALIIRPEDWSDEMRDFPASIVLAVVEVVSSGRAAIRRDYQDKHFKYEQAGIPVYVIVDPNVGKWQLFSIGAEGRYTLADSGVFGDAIAFPDPLGFTIATDSFRRYPDSSPT
ncbi:Uma2 family endonuclease [Streptacidiphilus sp. MAP12-33]|uniref:Uma2 family endonuclease n=1 Tax=Streptacidiphilus sp. MAP12-33 TaxID=3156266 RepID=UPI003515938B